MSFKKFLEDTYPELSGKITGGNYPPPPIVEILLKILSGVQLFALALIVFGDRVWTSILRFRQVPIWYYTIKEYGFQCGVALFFVIPNLLNQFVVTGAFEILVDGEVAYSKLEEGRLPNAADVLAVFEKLGLVSTLK